MEAELMAQASGGRRITLEFPQKGVRAEAVMLDGEARSLCDDIWNRLPMVGDAFHAVYSGSEVAMFLDPKLMLPPRNQTVNYHPGDVAFYCLQGGLWQGFPDDLSEVLVVYDRDGKPSMPWGQVPVCLFARIDRGLDEFARVCRTMRNAPSGRLEIRALGS
jgi:hypothetical protein